MAVNGMRYNWGWAYGGDNGISWSVEYNFSPTFAAAQTSLSMADGDGLVTGGITHYRNRSTPSGPDHDANFSWCAGSA